MTKQFLLGASVVIALMCTPLVHSAQSDANNQADSDEQAWNLKDVDIRTLSYEISKATGKNFVVGPKVNDKVTFITSHRLPKDELYHAFVALLNAYGYAAMPDGNVIKIISDNSKNQLRPSIRNNTNTKPRSDTIEMRVIRVENYPVNEMVKIIKPLIPKYSLVQGYAPSNDLIIADHVQHIEEIVELVKRMDERTTKDFEIIKLRYATADDMAKTLNTLLTSGGPGARKVSDVNIVSEPRSNSLVISNARFGQLKNLQALVARLDLPDDVANERTEVFYLKYLPAETVAPIVSGLIDSYMAEEKEKDPRKGQNTTTVSTTASATSGSSPSLSGQFNLQNPRSNFGGSTDAQSLGTYTANPPKSGAIGPHVQWEQSTNSIIITAPGAIIRRVRNVITGLDIRRPQVLIEAVIAEVSVNRVHEFGIEWANYGGTQLNTRFPTSLPLSGIGQNGNYTAGGVVDAIGSGLTFGVFKMGNLRFLLRALASDSDANVLATPNIVTLDNEPALIKVGRKVSFTVGQINNNPTGGQPFNSFDREDVGLVLSVKPTITPEGSIRLNITQELSSVLEGTERNNGNPDTSERFIQTTVIADNDQILVLGGLLQKEWSRTKDKTPILGSIPVVGALFSQNAKRLRKSNLMVFLHPIILYDKHDNNFVTTGKYEFLRQSQIHLQHNNVEPKVTPVLPIREHPVVLPPAFCLAGPGETHKQMDQLNIRHDNSAHY